MQGLEAHVVPCQVRVDVGIIDIVGEIVFAVCQDRFRDVHRLEKLLGSSEAAVLESLNRAESCSQRSR